MATAMTALELDLVTALEEMLELTEEMEPDLDERGQWGRWRGARIVAEIAIAHAHREPHCCWGNCDLDRCCVQPARPAVGTEVGA